MKEVIILTTFSIVSFYIGKYIGMRKGAEITKKIYRKLLNDLL